MGMNYQAQMLGGIAPPSMDPASFVHPAILRGLMDDFASNQNHHQASPFQCLAILTILLMEEILHQLRLVVYPTIYRVLHIPGGAEFLPSTVCLS